MKKETEFSQLEIANEHLDSFVICLALGTLREMRDGNMPYEIGIWTLGRPVFSCNSEVNRFLSKETIEVIQEVGEIDSIASTGDKEKANETLDDLIIILQTKLKSLGNSYWYARWLKPYSTN